MLNTDTAAVGTDTDWVAINIAADAQARMAATSTPTGLASTSCGSGCADSVYICTDSLCQSNADNTWQNKGGYEPTDSNLGSLSSYPNDVESDMNQADIDGVVDEVVDGLLNTVLKNPFSGKIMHEIISAVSRVISGVDISSPLKFNVDGTLAAAQIQIIEDFSADAGSLFVNVTDDALNFLIDQVIDDAENPQQTFTNLASGLGQFMAQVDADVMHTVYTALGQLTATDPNLIDDIMSQSDFLELDIPLLADLFPKIACFSALPVYGRSA